MKKTLILTILLVSSFLSNAATYIPIPVYYGDTGGHIDSLTSISFLIGTNIIMLTIYLVMTVKWLLSDKTSSFYEYVIWSDWRDNMNTISFVCINGSALLILITNIVYNILK